MRCAIAAVLVSFLAAGCASRPPGGARDGTYRDAGGAPDVLVADGADLTVYLPTMFPAWRQRLEGREFSYRVQADGSLRIYGSSNDAFYLRLTRDCDWRWIGSVIRCQREDGTVREFVRQAAGSLSPPASPEQQVWLAAATHVLANEAGDRRQGTLAIYRRTTFPVFRPLISQLEKQARQGFCGLAPEQSNGVIRALRWRNQPDRALGDVFDSRPQFQMVDEPDEHSALGLSRVFFDDTGTSAYLNVEIGRRTGSIVRFKLENHTWTWAEDCAQWISWR